MNDSSETDRRAGSAESLRLALVVAAIVIIAYVFTTPRADETLRAVIAALLFASLIGGVSHRAWFSIWPLVTAGLAAGILARPLDVPNHHWMMTYLSAAISLSTLFARDHQERLENLRSNARWLLVVLMAFATAQKLLSPQFMDATYIGFELTRGGFASPLLKLVPHSREIIEANAQLVEQLHTTPPAELPQVTLRSPFPALPWLAYGFTASIVLMEFWLCATMWLIPRRLITHLSLIAFAFTLAFLRQEFTFISVVCTLGLLACGSELRGLRMTYASLAIVIASAVLKTLND